MSYVISLFYGFQTDKAATISIFNPSYLYFYLVFIEGRLERSNRLYIHVVTHFPWYLVAAAALCSQGECWALNVGQ